ncbi:MAG TPA: hypothetical protein VGO59_02990 [Verrucomicrobiae bacterium]|jgi:hypothetical protein
MIPHDKTELFDNAALKVLDANNTPWGLQAAALCMFIREFGFAPSAAETVHRLEYLTARGMAQEVPKALGKSSRNWKITDAGRRHLDEQGL